MARLTVALAMLSTNMLARAVTPAGIMQAGGPLSQQPSRDKVSLAVVIPRKPKPLHSARPVQMIVDAGGVRAGSAKDVVGAMLADAQVLAAADKPDEEQKTIVAEAELMGAMDGYDAAALGRASAVLSPSRGAVHAVEAAAAARVGHGARGGTVALHTSASWGAMLVATALMVIGIVRFARYCTVQRETAEVACVIQLGAICILNLSYTLVIPSSYLIALVVGREEAYSGMLIGVQQLGVCGGGATMWFLLRQWPQLWRSGWELMRFATTCSLVGSVTFCVLICSSAHIADDPKKPPLSWIAVPLLIVRALDGFGTGIIVQLGQVSIIHLFPSKERPGWMATNQFAGMFGIGLGPMVSTAVSMVSVAIPGGPDAKVYETWWSRFRVADPIYPSWNLVATGLAYVGISLGTYLAVGFFFPRSMADVVDTQSPRRNDQPFDTTAADAMLPDHVEVPRWFSRVVLVWAALIMSSLRGFVVSSLEAGTAFLLQTDYGWEINPIGIAIGACFLFCIPVLLVYYLVQQHLSITAWVRLMALLAIGGSSFLYSPVCHALNLHGGCAYVLLFADAILFSTILLGDALTAGIMMMSQHLLPEGSWLDINHVVLFRGILVVGIGRNLGPPLSRMAVEAGGQDAYAAQQMMTTVLYLFIFELLVVPNTRLKDE